MHIHLVAPKPLFPFAAAGTELSAKIDNEGFVSDIVFVVPNFTNAITATLTIHDEDGNELYNSTAKAENAVYVITGIRVPVTFGFSAKVTLSGVAGGAGGTVSARLFIGA